LHAIRISDAQIDLDRSFADRFEFAQYLLSVVDASELEGLLDDVGTLSWLTVAYWGQFTSRGVSRHEHYIPMLGEWSNKLGHQRIDYRHCVRTPLLLVRKLGDDAKFFLQPRSMGEMGDIIEQVVSRQDVFGNEKFLRMIIEHYRDEHGRPRVGATGIPKRKKLRNGKWSPSGRGGIRRLIEGVLPRLKLTYNVYDLSTSSLIELAGPEFKVIRTQKSAQSRSSTAQKN
jgi:hypothetical protein